MRCRILLQIIFFKHNKSSDSYSGQRGALVDVSKSSTSTITRCMTLFSTATENFWGLEGFSVFLSPKLRSFIEHLAHFLLCLVAKLSKVWIVMKKTAKQLLTIQGIVFSIENVSMPNQIYIISWNQICFWISEFKRQEPPVLMYCPQYFIATHFWFVWVIDDFPYYSIQINSLNGGVYCGSV